MLTDKLSRQLHNRVLYAGARQVFYSSLRLYLNASIQPFTLHVGLGWICLPLILEIKCRLVDSIAISVDNGSIVCIACVLAN